MPYRAKAAAILREWRDVERRLAAATDDQTRIALQLELDRLKVEYQAVVAEAQAAHMPEPPAFPSEPPELIPDSRDRARGEPEKT